MRRGIGFGWAVAGVGGRAGRSDAGEPAPHPGSSPVATSDGSLGRERPGRLLAGSASPDDLQDRIVAEIVRRVRPDVPALNELDYDPAGRPVTVLRAEYRGGARNEAGSIAPARSAPAGVCAPVRDRAAVGPGPAGRRPPTSRRAWC